MRRYTDIEDQAPFGIALVRAIAEETLDPVQCHQRIYVVRVNASSGPLLKKQEELDKRKTIQYALPQKIGIGSQ